MIISGHAWPTWDIWIVPFYIYAVLLVSCGWWLGAGMVLAVGALFKGQQLLVAPLFILVPLLMGRPGAALRVVLGFGLGVVAVVGVWMLRVPLDPQRLERLYHQGGGLRGVPWEEGVYYDPIIDWRKARDPAAPLINWPAVWWVLSVTAGLALAAGRHLLAWIPRLARIRRRWWLLPAACGAALLLWRWQVASGGGYFWYGAMMTAIAIAVAWWLPGRRQGYLFAGAVTAALLLCIPFFHASTGWFTIGWCFGTYQWESMVMGLTDNIPGWLVNRFPWSFNDHESLLSEVWSIPAGALGFWPQEDIGINRKMLFAGIYGLTLVLCAWGAARHLRRGDRRFLVAMVAPWVLFFVILGQMHERYLLWGAALSAALVAVDAGYLLLHLFLTAASWVQIVNILMLQHARYGGDVRGPAAGATISARLCSRLYYWSNATHPDLAWAIAAAAGLLLYQAVAWRRQIPPAAPGTKKSDPIPVATVSRSAPA
jgi:hypothetical protein